MNNTEKTRIEWAIDQINARNAKKFALILVLSFACYHGILHFRYGTNSCRWLLSNGRYKGDKEWQPYGCMLHLYSKIDTRRCLRYIAFYGANTHFVFMGDTRMEDLYHDFIKHIQLDEESTTVSQTSQLDQNNLQYYDQKLKIRVEYYKALQISTEMNQLFRSWHTSTHPPSVVVVGCCLSVIKTSNGSLSMLEEYKHNITKLVYPLNQLHERKTKILWALQDPVYEDKLSKTDRSITNALIDIFNKEAIEVLIHSSATLWWSIRLVGEGVIEESSNGIKLSERALHHDTQILLNMYCNDYMNFNDGTCCSSTEPYTTLQLVTFSILALCVATFIMMTLQKYISKWKGRKFIRYTQLPESEHQPVSVQTKDYYTFFTALTLVALIMVYFFVCDRTNYFMKENKYYSEFSFWLPIGYVMALGLFFTEDSKFTKVLHRDQLNEWKGWMQLVILVYHMTGASRILPINMHIKVLVSSYLFLLGYEQFRYVWQRGDVSIVSFFRMLFQLNFMTVILCLCMNRPYQFYYFVPLLSFWYLMIYCFLAFPPHITAQSTENNIIQYLYILMKFIGLFIVITILFMSEVFFEKVFVTRPWKALFVTTDDDIHDWWYRWKLDRYSSMYGMMFALILILAQKYNIFDDNNHSNLFSRGIALSATLLAIIGIGIYITMTFLCRDEYECSEIHSYIVFIPIVSYIVLRNISGMLRTRYSSLFVWFGEISLELFISQYHIWLAADTHGVLVLLPSYPVLNVIITTFIFVCASHEIHRLTKVLLPYAVPDDWKLVLRNFILFLAILVPIGINDGMF